jgi:lipopolysaccharide transport system permease protein
MSRTITSPSQTDSAPAISQTGAYVTPDLPLVRIQPSTSWSKLQPGELWAYRELLYFLVWRDVKVRYKQTVFGAAWALLQPLLLMLIFTFFFSRLAGIRTDVPYPLFAYAGLLPWVFFAHAVTNSGYSLIVSTNLITKVYFPRLLIPMAAVAACLVDLAIAFVLLVVLMIYYQVGPHLEVLLLPLAVGLLTLVSFSVGSLLSALNVKYRDIRYVMPFLIQIWMFASPVIYPVPNRWRWLLALNPLTGIIESFRAAFLGLPTDWPTIAISAAITLVLLFIAVVTFGRMERGFADVI